MICITRHRWGGRAAAKAEIREAKVEKREEGAKPGARLEQERPARPEPGVLRVRGALLAPAESLARAAPEAWGAAPEAGPARAVADLG